MRTSSSSPSPAPLACVRATGQTTSINKSGEADREKESEGTEHKGITCRFIGRSVDQTPRPLHLWEDDSPKGGSTGRIQSGAMIDRGFWQSRHLHDFGSVLSPVAATTVAGTALSKIGTSLNPSWQLGAERTRRCQ